MHAGSDAIQVALRCDAVNGATDRATAIDARHYLHGQTGFESYIYEAVEPVI